jgi:hypothetical protein
MSILPSDATIDDALYLLQADRVLLVSLANAFREPVSEYEKSQFVAVVERVERETESLAYRLTITNNI